MPNPNGARRRSPRPRSATVRRTEQLTDSLVRVVLGGAELAGFDPVHADSYVKIVFLHPDATYERPIDLDRIRETMPAEHWARQRTYSVRRWDAAAQELTIDFVVHGDSGLAGPWARRARPGDEVLIQGPGGDYTPDPSVDFHLLAGDESALPALAAALETMPPNARGAAFVEVHGPGDELVLAKPAGVDLVWLHRGDAGYGTALVDAVRAWPVPDGTGQWFVHGEAGAVRELRRYLRRDLGLPLTSLSISGYWRLGADDEAWRAVKREWLREVEASEVSLVG